MRIIYKHIYGTIMAVIPQLDTNMCNMGTYASRARKDLLNSNRQTVTR